MPFLSSLPTVDPQSVVDGAALWNNGFKNYLINGDFGINQRAFAGGALAAGIYGFDRWKAGTGGCNISLSAGVLTHTSGPLVQVIEAPNLAGETITVSVDGLSGGSLDVNVEGVTGVIAASASRAGVTLTVPSTSTGNVTVTLTPASGAVTYKRVQVELGSVATGFGWRPLAAELPLALRYYWRGVPSGSGINTNIYTGSAYQSFFIQFPARMRAIPAASQTGVSISAALDPTVGIVLSPSVNGCRILVMSVSSGGNPNAYLSWDSNGVTSFFEMDAEL